MVCYGCWEDEYAVSWFLLSCCMAWVSCKNHNHNHALNIESTWRVNIDLLAEEACPPTVRVLKKCLDIVSLLRAPLSRVGSMRRSTVRAMRSYPWWAPRVRWSRYSKILPLGTWGGRPRSVGVWCLCSKRWCNKWVGAMVRNGCWHHMSLHRYSRSMGNWRSIDMLICMNRTTVIHNCGWDCLMCLPAWGRRNCWSINVNLFLNGCGLFASNVLGLQCKSELRSG